MVNARTLFTAILTTVILTATLFMVSPIRSATYPYDPWGDVSGPTQGVPDGIINMRDINYLILRFNTFGTPINRSLYYPEPIKIAMVLATGGLGDKGFNDVAYAGMMRAKDELNITFDYAQPAAIADYEGFQRGFAADGGYAAHSLYWFRPSGRA